MAVVVLTIRFRGLVVREVVVQVDDEDAEVLSIPGWKSYPPLWYVVRLDPRTRPMTSYLHRVVARRMLGRPLVKGEVVDHINHDPTDNRRANLRVVTQSQNLLNRRVSSASFSGYLGVSWHKAAAKWEVHAKDVLAGKKVYGGLFEHLPDAVAAAKGLRKSLGYPEPFD